MAAAVIDNDVLVCNGHHHTRYIQPYWIPNRYKNQPMIPCTEMLGPWLGYIVGSTPRMPPNEGRKEAAALWSASEELTSCS